MSYKTLKGALCWWNWVWWHWLLFRASVLDSFLFWSFALLSSSAGVMLYFNLVESLFSKEIIISMAWLLPFGLRICFPKSSKNMVLLPRHGGFLKNAKEHTALIQNKQTKQKNILQSLKACNSLHSYSFNNFKSNCYFTIPHWRMLYKRHTNHIKYSKYSKRKDGYANDRAYIYETQM